MSKPTKINARHAIKKYSKVKIRLGFQGTTRQMLHTLSYTNQRQSHKCEITLQHVANRYAQERIFFSTTVTYLHTQQSNYGFPIPRDSSPLKLHPEATTFLLYYPAAYLARLPLHFDVTRNTPKQVRTGSPSLQITAVSFHYAHITSRKNRN